MKKLFSVFIVVLTVFTVVPLVEMFALRIDAPDRFADVAARFEPTIQRIAPNSNIDGLERVTWIPISNFSKAGYLALRGFTGFDSNRRVTINSVADFKEIAEEAAQELTGVNQDNYLVARMPRIAAEECEALKAAFASSCMVSSTSARRGNDGRYRLSMTLLFVQRESFGEIPEQTELSYLEIVNLLVPPIAGPAASYAELVARLRQIYAQTAQACAVVRRENGNCAVYSLVVETRSTPPSREQSIRGHTRYSIVQAI